MVEEYPRNLTELEAGFAWCEARGLQDLAHICPVVVAGYIEELGGTLSAPTAKQHLAAFRMLFDYLVTGQVVPMNPAACVRAPSRWPSAAKPRC